MFLLDCLEFSSDVGLFAHADGGLSVRYLNVCMKGINMYARLFAASIASCITDIKQV